MAPNRGPSKPSSTSSKKPSSSSSKPLSSSSRISKSKPSSSKKPNGPKRPPPKEVKSKPRTAPEHLKKKKKRVYTEKELDLPTLNTITPVGVTKPRGKKKGKVFVDDQESMMTILAMVNAEKEGQIESKMMKARQMEEIREARRKEAEVRQEGRKAKLEDVKDSLRRKRSKGGNDAGKGKGVSEKEDSVPASKATRKKVSFA
ncbi:60S ribosomal subunit assembly/export protein [Emmonsiellopsis sp. PD_5]|nr:60S ribosomal subunit assembly/export protein [Emmonsiellopsis sp. PD_5]